MSGLFSSFDWRKSPAHLLLLSKFLKPQDITRFYTEVWKEALRENPRKAGKRLLKAQVIAPADLSGLLQAKFKVSELKSLLKKHQLPVSGRKDDLVARLIQADPGGMKKLVRGMNAMQCTDAGREVAEQYVVEEKAKRELTEQQVLEALHMKDFTRASRLVSSYEAQQVFSRGLGIDWNDHDPTRDIETLGFIFSGHPRLLAEITSETLDELRPAAGMMFLWGTGRGKKWIRPDLETGMHLDSQTAARMLESYALHKSELEEYRQGGWVNKVRVLGANDSQNCAACKKLNNRRFDLDKVPELPYEKCTSEMGCRCTIDADFE